MMDIKLNLFSFIFLISAAQPFFLIVLLLKKKKSNRAANTIFAILITLYCLILLGLTFETNDYFKILLNKFPHLIGTLDGVFTLFGPLHFLHAEMLLGKRKLKWYDALHALPFLIKMKLLLPIFLATEATKNEIVENINRTDTNVFNESNIIFLLFITYLIIVLVRLNTKYAKSEGQQHLRKWIKRITSLTLSMLAIQGIVVLFWEQMSRTFIQQDYSIGLILSIFLLLITYWVYSQPGILISQSDFYQKKYRSSNLSDQKAHQLEQQLLRFLETEKIFLSPDLTLHSLAKEMNALPNHLSQVTNQRFGMKFNELINSYRIAHFKEIILDPEHAHLTLEGLAYNCGFNSKTTFNSSFKRLTGKTPKQYRQQLRPEEK